MLKLFKEIKWLFIVWFIVLVCTFIAIVLTGWLLLSYIIIIPTVLLGYKILTFLDK